MCWASRGPTPLQAYMDDDDDSPGAVGPDHGMGEELQLGVGLENIETEEIQHDSMHLVSGGAADAAAAGGVLPDSAVPDVVEGQDLVISAAGLATDQWPERAGDKPDDLPPGQEINFPPLEEDAAAILGMTDLALTNENTSLQSVAARWRSTSRSRRPPARRSWCCRAPACPSAASPTRSSRHAR